jgi:hypothetical protein
MSQKVVSNIYCCQIWALTMVPKIQVKDRKQLTIFGFWASYLLYVMCQSIVIDGDN